MAIDVNLLIVPEGIEISYGRRWSKYRKGLLIVPEGIEIRTRFFLFDCKQSFNRTRRN